MSPFHVICAFDLLEADLLGTKANGVHTSFRELVSLFMRPRVDIELYYLAEVYSSKMAHSSLRHRESWHLPFYHPHQGTEKSWIHKPKSTEGSRGVSTDTSGSRDLGRMGWEHNRNNSDCWFEPAKSRAFLGFHSLPPSAGQDKGTTLLTNYTLITGCPCSWTQPLHPTPFGYYKLK